MQYAHAWQKDNRFVLFSSSLADTLLIRVTHCVRAAAAYDDIP